MCEPALGRFENGILQQTVASDLTNVRRFDAARALQEGEILLFLCREVLLIDRPG